MRPLHHPDRASLSLPGVLYALGDPVRLNIVQQLAAQGDLCCNAFNAMGEGAIAKSTLSHHFKILRESGVVQSRKVGTTHMNALRRDDLEARFPGLLAAILQSATAARAVSGDLVAAPSR